MKGPVREIEGLEIGMLMKVLSHPGHGNCKSYVVGNWTCFSFLKTFHLSSERLLQFRNEEASWM